MSWSPPDSRTRSSRPLFAVLPLVAILPFLAGSLGLVSEKAGPVTCRVVRGDFVHEVAVRGDLESEVNVEVRCEVRSRGSPWTRILEVVPEGTIVKPGDFLLRLDASALETERMQQQILLEQAEAWLIQTQSNLAIAQAARREYLAGEYTLQRQQAETALFLSEEKSRRAARYVEYSRQMAARQYITPLQLRDDEFAVTAAENERKLAETRLHVLEHFTKTRRLKELDGTLASCKARMTSAQKICRIRHEQLADIEAQIAKCEIRAPVGGQVVLAHLHHQGHSHMIEPGEMAMEKRVLIRLPDPRRMQITALVNEDRIALIRPEAPVRIYLDAFPEHELQGKVIKVNEYPNPETWMGPAVKRYETIISVETSSLPLRPGLTADMQICVNQRANQLLVPCHAVLEHGEKNYCLSTDGYRLIAQEVAAGPSNGRFTVIESGLDEGQEVVLGAAGYRDQVALPELPKSPKPPGLAADLSGHVCVDVTTTRAF